MKDNARHLTLAAIAASLMVTGLNTRADGPPAVDHLFALALKSDGREYVALRAAILAQQTATNFLQDQVKSDTLRIRVIAAGMLGWSNERNVNLQRQDLLLKVLASVSHQRGGMLSGIQGAAFGVWTGVGSGHVQPTDVLHDDKAVPFLLEMTLKGSVDTGVQPEPHGRLEPRWARCFAAALVGEYQGTDVIPLLKDIAASDPQPELRACALLGLRRTGSPIAVEPLITALMDHDHEVRRVATLSLIAMTGQDFRGDAAAYRDWWQQHKSEYQGRKLPTSRW